MLIHLIYASTPSHKFTEDELISLLGVGRSHNSKEIITGMLLYCEDTFFQVLEGEEEGVLSLFQKISRDPRHTKITKIIQEPIHKRAFEDWSMGYIGLTREQLTEIEGLNDFFQDSTCLSDIDYGRAKKLLKAFSSGRWRQKLR